MMNPLCFVTITLHFEIRNSEMYGGNGSVGYSASSFQGVAHPEQADDSFVEAQRRITAKLLSVPVEDVTVITRMPMMPPQKNRKMILMIGIGEAVGKG